MFKIEKGIPLPKHAPNKKYRFEDMEVGDSVFIKGGTPRTIGQAARVFCFRHGKRFLTATEKNGVRIWRSE